MDRKNRIHVICVLLFAYAIGILFFILQILTFNLRLDFNGYIREPVVPAIGEELKPGDLLIRVGEINIEQHLSKQIQAPARIQREIRLTSSMPDWCKVGESETYLIRCVVYRPSEQREITCWLELGNVALRDLVPSLSWFGLKVVLFMIGALVCWFRPNDPGAHQFYLFSAVTMAAYLGGYNWHLLATEPLLLVVFIVCAVLLPLVSLNFYLHFPHKKSWIRDWPRAVWVAVYGTPFVFLLGILIQYWHLRSLQFAPAIDAITIKQWEDLFGGTIFTYIGVAAIYYLGCVGCLLHSFRKAESLQERNQVKIILGGAVLSLAPIAYALYVAMFDRDAFAGGATTWPMFGASAILSIAYAISITRYRLMELDKIINSGVGYFLFSVGAGIVYYAVVIATTLIFSRYVTGPNLYDLLTFSLSALILMLMLDLARRPIQAVLERRFSRSKIQLDQTLDQMSQAVSQLVDPQALAQNLLQAIVDFFGAAGGAVYVRTDKLDRLSQAGLVGALQCPRELFCDQPLLQGTQTGRIAVLPAWGTAHPSPSQRQLEQFGAEIALPWIRNGEVLALLILGPKGTPFRSEDFNLLATFAQIGVLALDSAGGHRTIDQLNRELQGKLEKIAEQQRRILALQSQLRHQSVLPLVVPETKPAPPVASTPDAPAAAERTPELRPGGIIGSSVVVRELLSLVKKVAPTEAVVLIRGESGTGKELLAKAIHESSPRAGHPFIKVHCAALSAGVLESELFGHVKGAFTGAHKDKAGRFELAHTGTLFLDEIGDISLEVQTKLLRVLQERQIERVGSGESLAVDVRIVTATHQNLETLIQQGKFREDLFYRLNVFPIQVPALRERVEDLVELVQYFVQQAAEKCRKPAFKSIEDDALSALKAYPWPGNIRQLENVIERAVVIAEGSVLRHEDLPKELFADLHMEPQTPTFDWLDDDPVPALATTTWREQRHRKERETLQRALEGAQGNKAEAARALGMARSTLVSKLKKHGMLSKIDH